MMGDAGDGSPRLSVPRTFGTYGEGSLPFKSPELTMYFGLPTARAGGKLPLIFTSHFLLFSIRAFVFSEITT